MNKEELHKFIEEKQPNICQVVAYKNNEFDEVRIKDIVSIDWTTVVKAQEHRSRKIVQKTAKKILKKIDVDENVPKKYFHSSQ